MFTLEASKPRICFVRAREREQCDVLITYSIYVTANLFRVIKIPYLFIDTGNNTKSLVEFEKANVLEFKSSTLKSNWEGHRRSNSKVNRLSGCIGISYKVWQITY